MCVQIVCRVCGHDLEDDHSLVLCLNLNIMPWLSENNKNCPDYVRSKASGFTRCNFCSEVALSSLQSFWGPTNPTFDHTGFLYQPPAEQSALAASAPFTGLPIYPQLPSDTSGNGNFESHSWGISIAQLPGTTYRDGQINVPMGSTFSVGRTRGLRPLCPKPPANQHAIHFRAPAPPHPQNIQYLDKTRVVDNADVNTASAGPYVSAPREADRVGQANAATEQMGLLSTERQTAGLEKLASTNSKSPINRVRKPENRQSKGRKIAVACENCRTSRVRCSGEVPSCERCVSKGKQCGGYRTPKTAKKPRQAAAVSSTNRNLPAGAPNRVPAPQIRAWTSPFAQDLQRRIHEYTTTLNNDVWHPPLHLNCSSLLWLFDLVYTRHGTL